ncbi:MAG: hypothetical protein AAFZ01_04820 [Pseudomonadota bacterium]
MKNIWRVLFLSAMALGLATVTPSASAESPASRSCAVALLLSKDGLGPAKKRFAKIVDWLDDTVAGQMVAAFELLGDRKFSKADVFLLAGLPGYVEEHLLIVDIEEDGVLYIRLTYVSYLGDLKVAHFSIDDSYEKLLARRSISGAPRKLECAS